jgi:hypothetical protein
LKEEVFEVCGALARAESLLRSLGRPGDAAYLGAAFDIVEGRLAEGLPTAPEEKRLARRSAKAS